LRQVVARVRVLMLFHINTWIVLPKHMRCPWTLPQRDANFCKRCHAIKTASSRSMPPGEPRSTGRRARGERRIWQRRYWEHPVRDECDYASHMDYIHCDPVKHGISVGAAG
jgi:putative transposase